ncbi:MAG: HEAT repeat domain-containing protein [Acidobacteriota bacterium]
MGFYTFILCWAVSGAAILGEVQKEAAELFQRGYSQVLGENYQEGVQTLREVINRFPKSGWVDDSQFWLCYAQGRQQPGSKEAFGCFEKFVEEHQRSKFVDDAQAQMIEIGQELVRQGQPEYADKVRSMRESQDDELAVLALRALADIGDEESIQAILSLYSPQKSEQLRVWIVRVLEDLESPQARTRLIEIARQDPSVAVRSRAVRSLGDQEWGEEIQSFMRDLARSDGSEEIRRRAINAIGDTEDPQWIPLLVEIALEPDNESLSRRALSLRALSAIEDIGGSQALQALKQIYSSAQSDGLRRRALRQIAEIGGEESLALLEQAALEAPDEDTRRTAVLAMGEIESPQALQALSRLASSSPDASIRRYALRALEELEDESAIPLLAKALQEDADPGVRRQAARSLGEFESDLGVESLKEAALNDSHSDVRRAAVRALGEIGSSAAKQALVEILKK